MGEVLKGPAVRVTRLRGNRRDIKGPVGRRTVVIVFVVLLWVLLLPVGSFAEGRPVSSKKVVEQVVHRYLIDHPEVVKKIVEQNIRQYLVEHPEAVMQAMQRYQLREDKKRAKLANAAMSVHGVELYSDRTSPMVGGSESAVQIVEFFDYRCAFCRRVDPIIRTVVEENPNVRVIYKEFPILGPDSLLAAKASMAAYQQGAFLRFHEALISESGAITSETIDALVTQFGLNLPKFKQDMESAGVAGTIQNTQKLAEALQIEATPTFIIGGEFVKGVLDAKTLQAKIAKAQARQQLSTSVAHIVQTR